MAETLARSLIRLVVTIAILAAIYLFIVKPVLDTTNNTINRAFDGSESVSNQIRDSLDAADVSGAQVDLRSQRQAQRVLRCIQRAKGDVDRISRCNGIKP
jgi:hypothetical protein